jgi:hypothetical protein
MGHHLPVVFPWGFGVEKKDKMQVERHLHEIVHLDNAGEGYMRVPCPEARGKVIVNIL